MKDWGPVIAAFLAAWLGTAFAFRKTRKERIWSDRYETLRKVVQNAETIQFAYEVEEQDELGIAAIGPKYKERLSSELPKTHHNLRRAIAQLRLLFEEREIAEVRENHSKIVVAVYDLINNTDPGEYPEAHAAVATAAKALTEAAISVAQKNERPGG